MKVCFILETRNPPHPNKIILKAARLLESRGVKVNMIYPEQKLWRMDRLAVEADVYLLKSDSELALSLAHSLELRGAYVINPCEACRKLKDKALTAGLLFQAGISTPESFAAGNALAFVPNLKNGPLILKPNRGYHGVGLCIVERESGLNAVPEYSDMVFAQSYLVGGRNDIKIFGLGSDVFALRKPFSQDSFKHSGTPIRLTQGYERIARRCAETFNLSLYGIDLVEYEGEEYVVDVNYFPGYRGVEAAAEKLSDFVWRAAKDPR